MKKRKLKSLNLNKKSISSLQSKEVYGGTGPETTLTPTIVISYFLCPEEPKDETVIVPDTMRVCDESIKICV